MQPYGSFFGKFSSEVEKCIMWNSIQVLPNQVSKISFYTFEDIDLQEPMQSYIKNQVILYGGRLSLKVRNQYLLSSSELQRISDVFCTVFVYRNEKYIYYASE